MQISDTIALDTCYEYNNTTTKRTFVPVKNN